MGEPVLTSQLYLYTGQNTYATMMVDKNANNQLTIENMSAGGDINLLTNGGGEVRVNGSPIGLTTNALITDQPLVVPEEGSIVYFDGANNVSTTSTNKLKFDSSNNYILVDGVIQPQRSEIDFLQDEINTLSGNISGLNSSVLALSRRCDSLETITTAQGVDISTLKQDVLDLREEDTLLQTQITDLDGYVATNTTNITSNTTQINSLDVAVNALNSTTISQQSQINTNSSNITTNTINIATNTSDIATNTSKINQNTTAITSLGTYANPAMLRAMNCNNWTPTTSYDIHWLSLNDEQKLLWKGGDDSTVSPVQSSQGNYWSFSKGVSSQKIGWYIPVDLSSLSFVDLESFWAVIRFNNTTTLTTEGTIYFQITTLTATAPNYFRTRINYSNSGTVMNQTAFFYKVYCLDTITLNTSANFGKAQEVGQSKYRLNPMNVRSDLWSIPFNKLVASPSGNLDSGWTNGSIQSISLQTSSNINNLSFDVISIGYLDKQYNLFYE